MTAPDTNAPHNPYAAPSTAGIDGSVAQEPTSAILASRTKRLISALIDSGLYYAIAITIIALTGYDQVIATGQMSLDETIIASLIGISIWLTLNLFLLVTRGQTIGKLVTKIQIADVDTNKLLPIGRAYFLRYLWVFPLVAVTWFVPEAVYFLNIIVFIDIMMILTDDQRCLHDWIAGSKVV